jgi:hypothetical protein
MGVQLGFASLPEQWDVLGFFPLGSSLWFPRRALAPGQGL